MCRKGQKLGDWELTAELGSGGNGQVWEATKHGEEASAIKVLGSFSTSPQRRKKRRQRFIDEVTAIKRISDIDGILPIIDDNITSSTADDHQTLWYVMPVAQKVNVDSMSPIELVDAVAKIANTMAQLHDRDVTHRDIKPPNILMYQKRPVVADFGLVRYPGKVNLTGKKEKLGPYGTMPQEARNGAKGTDGKALDVFELAKTLWIYLAQKDPAFEGQYNPNHSDALNNFQKEINCEPLDRILEKCTDSDPQKRPSMRWLSTELAKWIQMEKNSAAKGAYQWDLVPKQLFPFRIPRTARWESLNDIVDILKRVGEVGAFNHMFYPSGGGWNLYGAERAKEQGCIVLRTGGGEGIDIAKPEFLSFEHFPANTEWNYFWLELAPLNPVLESTSGTNFIEEVCEISPGQYLEYDNWYHNNYKGQPLPSGARPAARLLSGGLAIFMTRSMYNEIDDYSGRFVREGYQEFRRQVQHCSELSIDGPPPKCQHQPESNRSQQD